MLLVSYDLNFYPRSGELDFGAVRSWLTDQPSWKFGEQSAVYENDDTGVYMVLDLNEDLSGEQLDPEDPFPPGPLTALINLYRPSFFGIECTDALGELVAKFDLLVIDLQEDAVEPGEFSADAVNAAWQAANAGAHKAMRTEDPSALRMPRAELMAAWRWNRNVETLWQQLNNPFVPHITPAVVDGRVTTVAVWGDAIPTAIPGVPFVVVARKKLARGWSKQNKSEATAVPRSELERALDRHLVRRDGRLDYLEQSPPPDVVKWIQRLKMNKRNFGLAGWDRVHDDEYYAD